VIFAAYMSCETVKSRALSLEFPSDARFLTASPRLLYGAVKKEQDERDASDGSGPKMPLATRLAVPGTPELHAWLEINASHRASFIGVNRCLERNGLIHCKLFAL
jgi:hypothetical protein